LKAAIVSQSPLRYVLLLTSGQVSIEAVGGLPKPSSRKHPSLDV